MPRPKFDQAVELSKTDPDRWITLVRFMVVTKQLAKAQKAIKDAESVIPPDQAPLALAQCCEMMGRAYEPSGEGVTKQWYTRATEWFEKAKAAHPDDFSIVRRLGFLSADQANRQGRDPIKHDSEGRIEAPEC